MNLLKTKDKIYQQTGDGSTFLFYGDMLEPEEVGNAPYDEEVGPPIMAGDGKAQLDHDEIPVLRKRLAEAFRLIKGGE